MKYKWFWITLCTWFVLGGVSTWALIYSPLQLFSKQISRIDVEVNGQKQKYEFQEFSNSLEDCLVKTMGQWKKEGWICRSGNINFANLLLGLKNDNTLLSSCLHISVFQRDEMVRILGLWNDRNISRTYECIAEIPKNGLERKARMPRWDFPMRPSLDAFQPCWARFSDFEIAIWFQPVNRNFENRFIELLSSQGFEGKLWSKKDGETVYLVRRGNIRLLALLKPGKQKDVVSLMSLNIH